MTKEVNYLKFKWVVFVVAVWVLFTSLGVAWAASDPVLSKWEKTVVIKDTKYSGEVEITVTWYADEYLARKLEIEAEKNLWTKSELEEYKYRLLKTLKYEEYIPVKVSIINRGPTMHMAPFGEQIVLWAKGKKYTPVDYDKIFNFPVKEKVEGIVYFPKYNEKTGKSILDGASSVKVSIRGGITSIGNKTYIDFIFDAKGGKMQGLFEGSAAERLEADRLIKRLEKLNDQKKELQKQLEELEKEIQKIEERLNELQG